MIYTEMTQKAMKLCFDAHAGQLDKGGMPYVLHPVHLAEQMEDEVTTVVALLHDVVEDTAYTFDDLEAMGFDMAVLDALKLLTHADGVEYMDYVRAIAGNPVARKVKMADLAHNLDETRLPDPSANIREKRKLYRKALNLLTEAQAPAVPVVPVEETTLAALEKQYNNRFRDQIRGCLLGGAAGDALGYEVEFISHSQIVKRFGENGITEFVPHDGYARFSDDTQMTLYTAAGLLCGATRAENSDTPVSMEKWIHKCYLDWLETQYATGNHKAACWLNNVRALYAWQAPGNTCLSALASHKMGSVAKPLNHSKGCGGVMRVAPVGLFFKNTRENGRPDQILDIMRLAGEAAAITHGHPLGYIPAAALAQMVSRIVYGGCKYGTMPWDILRECKELLVTLYGDDEYTQTMNGLLDQAASLAGNGMPDVENIHALGGGWVGDEALAIAVYCWLKYPHDFDKALIAAVNHSGDADSTGAVLGNILGAAVGYENLSLKWTEELEMVDVTLQIADDLCDGPRAGALDDTWKARYLSGTYTPGTVQA